MLDENLVFAVIGIADTIGPLANAIVSKDSSGTDAAGELTKYNFYFKTSQNIPGGSYMKFQFQDSNFGLSANPSCSQFAINGKIIQGKLSCKTVGNEIVITGNLLSHSLK